MGCLDATSGLHLVRPNCVRGERTADTRWLIRVGPTIGWPDPAAIGARSAAYIDRSDQILRAQARYDALDKPLPLPKGGSPRRAPPPGRRQRRRRGSARLVPVERLGLKNAKEVSVVAARPSLLK